MSIGLRRNAGALWVDVPIYSAPATREQAR